MGFIPVFGCLQSRVKNWIHPLLKLFDFNKEEIVPPPIAY